MNRRRLFIPVIAGGVSYLTPSEGAGQTGEWDASKWATSLYTDAGTTLATAADQAIYRLADLSGNSRHFDQSTAGARGLLKFNVQNGLAGVLLDGTDDYYATVAALSAYFGAQAKTAYMVFKVVTIGSDNPTNYANDPVLIDSGVYWGVTMRLSGPLYHYNYDGTADANQSTIASGEACVVAGWHDTTNIYMTKNNGATDTDASGATQSMAGTLQLGRRAPDFSNIYFLQASLHNAVHTDAVRESIVSGLMAKWGIT